jgi:hypothetical protein
MNAAIFEGSDEFTAVQLSNLLGWKILPFEQAEITKRGRRFILKFKQEAILMSSGILKTHQLTFQLPNATIRDPVLSDRWYPSGSGEMMRYGNRSNTSIPDTMDEAEFPPETWPLAETIRIRPASLPPPPDSVSVGGPTSPKSWKDVNLGHAPGISQAAAGLDGCSSPNTGQAGDQPPPDPAAEAESHEIQYWEVSRFLPPIGTANELYSWLAQGIVRHDITGALPSGMPATGEEMEVYFQRRGDSAYIGFIHKDNRAAGLDDMPNTVQIKYENGHALIGMPDRYTTRMLFGEFDVLTDGWRLLPTPSYRRDAAGFVIHDTLTDWKPNNNNNIYAGGPRRVPPATSDSTP